MELKIANIHKKIVALTVGVLAILCFIPSVTLADVILQQTVFSSTVTSGTTGNAWWKLGTGLTGYASGIQLFEGTGNGANTTAAYSILCYTDSGYTSRCASQDIGLTNTVTISATSTYSFMYSNNTMAFASNRYYLVYLASLSGSIYTMGTLAANTCAFATCNGTPFFLLYADDDPVINWAGIGFPVVYSSSSAAMAASSSLWGSISFASSTPLGTCPISTDYFGFAGAICNSFAYLFMPASTSWTQFQNVPTLLLTKEPFSFITSISTIFAGLNQSASFTPITYTPPTFYGKAATTTFTVLDLSLLSSTPAWSSIQLVRTSSSYIMYLLFGIYAFTSIFTLI